MWMSPGFDPLCGKSTSKVAMATCSARCFVKGGDWVTGQRVICLIRRRWGWSGHFLTRMLWGPQFIQIIRIFLRRQKESMVRHDQSILQMKYKCFSIRWWLLPKINLRNERESQRMSSLPVTLSMNVPIFRTWWGFKKERLSSAQAVCISVSHLQRSGLKCRWWKAWPPRLGADPRPENCSAYLEQLVSDSLIFWPKPQWKWVHSRKTISSLLWLKKGLESQVKQESNLPFRYGTVLSTWFLPGHYQFLLFHMKFIWGGVVLEGWLPSFMRDPSASTRLPPPPPGGKYPFDIN